MTEPVHDGAITVTFLNAKNEPVLSTVLEESADEADEFLARYLVSMVRDVGTAGALISIARPNGRPTGADRLLWSLIEPLPGSAAVTDLVVTGEEKSCSLRSSAAA
jgi:hypothetical protein